MTSKTLTVVTGRRPAPAGFEPLGTRSKALIVVVPADLAGPTDGLEALRASSSSGFIVMAELGGTFQGRAIPEDQSLTVGISLPVDIHDPFTPRVVIARVAVAGHGSLEPPPLRQTSAGTHHCH